MSFMRPLLCVFCVFNIVYCNDEPSYCAFIISTEGDQLKCNSTVRICKAEAGQKIEVPIISTLFINDATVTKDQSYSQNTQDNSTSPFYFHRHPKWMIMMNNNVDKLLEGNWSIRMYMLRDVNTSNTNIVELVERDKLSNNIVHKYTEVICSMQISVTDAVSLVCEGSCIYIWISLSVLMCITIIVETFFICYYIYQAKQNKKYAQLSSVVESNGNHGDNARYCGNPSQKPTIARDRDSSRESGIYEALETLQIGRPPIPEPPQLETLPRSPKPIPMKILREPLPDPPPVHSSLLRAPTNNTPTSMTRNKNKLPVPTKIEDENTYEPPPNYREPLPNASPEPEAKESTLTNVNSEKTKETLTKKQKSKKKSKEKARTSFERIKDRPPMPIPPELMETQEVYEETTSSSTLSLLRNAGTKNTSSPSSSLARNAALKNALSPTSSLARNAAPKNTLSPTSSLARNAAPKNTPSPTASLARNGAPNKPIVSKKPFRPKQPAEPKEGSMMQFTKSKPDISQKHTQINQPDNVANELNNILQKRKDQSPGSSIQDTNTNPAKAWLRSNSNPNQPDNAADELSNILKKRKETSAGMNKTDSPIAPATQYPRKIETPIAASPAPPVRPNAKVKIHVDGANYDGDEEDEDWTYEQLEDFNIYSV